MGMSKCEKCNDAQAVHRHHFGYCQIKGGSRWMRYWMLCTQCLENAKTATAGKQHPLWYIETGPGGKGIKLVPTDKTIWPDEIRGRNYGTGLGHL
jgi:hypothetical protein